MCAVLHNKENHKSRQLYNICVGTPERQVHREVGSGILQANRPSDDILRALGLEKLMFR